MKKCMGCGVELQYTDPKKIGYTPKTESGYCQRCYRITHYDDLMISMKQGISDESVWDKINCLKDTVIVWVVDLFDFESNMIRGINEKLKGKPIILVGTKRDLLPETMSDHKLRSFVSRRCKELEIKIESFVITGSRGKIGKDELLTLLEQVKQDKSIVFIGKANAGKSTLINALANEPTLLTASRYPGTTLELNTIDLNGVRFIDTPGLENCGSMLNAANEKDLKTILCAKCVKPIIYQCHGNQSFAIGGLARIDLEQIEGSAVFYCGELLKIHRGKIANAEQLWQNNYGTLLKPCVKTNPSAFKKLSFEVPKEKFDIVICGLGWCAVSGTVKNISVYVPEEVRVEIRKAML